MPGDELRLRLNSSAYANLAGADAGKPWAPAWPGGSRGVGPGAMDAMDAMDADVAAKKPRTTATLKEEVANWIWPGRGRTYEAFAQRMGR